MLQVPPRLLFLILLLFRTAYSPPRNGFPVSSVPMHLSIVRPEGTPAGAPVPVLGVHQAVHSLCYYLSQLPPAPGF